MLVLVAIATITVEATSQLAFDGRYQITQDRYDKIKTAILGNPNQTINGHPSVSGFVADMGRLPACLRELVDGYCETTAPLKFATDQNYCLEDGSLSQSNCVASGDHWMLGSCSDATKITEADCKAASDTWTPNNTGLSYGWRGGYVETPNASANINALTDGWGRTAQGICTNPLNLTTLNAALYSSNADCIANGGTFFNYGACIASDGITNLTAFTNATDCANNSSSNHWTLIDDNYGWGFDYSNSQLTIRSYGKDWTDNTASTNITDEYDKDYPQSTLSTISTSDWNATLPSTASVTITPTATTATATATCIIPSGSTTCALAPTALLKVYYRQNGVMAIPIIDNASHPTLAGTATRTNTTVCTATGYTTDCPTSGSCSSGSSCKTNGVSVSANTICSCTNATLSLTSTQPSLVFSLLPTQIPIGKIAYSVNFYDDKNSTTIIPTASNPNALPVIIDAPPRQMINFLPNW
jgi:hypothetical protein